MPSADDRFRANGWPTCDLEWRARNDHWRIIGFDPAPGTSLVVYNRYGQEVFKADKKAGKEPSTNTLLLVILAILLPPLAVYLHQGEINNKFWIALILTLLFWLPGIIYALVVILGNK